MINYIILAALVVLIVVVVLKQKNTSSNKEDMLEKQIDDLYKNLNSMSSQINMSISALVNQVNSRLKENMEFDQRSQINMQNTMSNLNKQLGELSQSNKRIYDMSKDIVSLQEILKAPKLRGVLGEYFLKDMLSQVFPKDRYEDQHRFKSGEQVDAVIYLENLKIPVDSKFPLENFKKMVEEQEESQKIFYQNMFVSDVKKHIDSIAKKYILPDEGTADFAIMYIPAENVYYQAMINDVTNKDLLSYAFKKKVIPVSPSSFYAYIQTILMGLHGFEIEKNASLILKNLSQVRVDLVKFSDDFKLVGTHLLHASSSYTNSEKRFDKISDKIENLSKSSDNQLTENNELR